MRASFSPTLEAARKLAVRTAATKSTSPFATSGEQLWCEWPRRASAPGPRGGIWRALQAIQSRHA